jgi:preprotein translocase subunit Sss1
VQTLATIVGATFLLVGILGFIPGITSHLYGGLDFAGHGTQA